MKMITQEATEYLLDKSLDGYEGTVPVSDIAHIIINNEYGDARKGAYHTTQSRIRQSLKYYSKEERVLTANRDDKDIQYRIVKEGTQFRAVLV